MNILKLFLSFLKIGAFSFGGGYAMLPLIRKEIIEVHGWLTVKEFIDILAVVEMTPGPVAINSATFFRIQGSRHMGGIYSCHSRCDIAFYCHNPYNSSFLI